MGRTRCRRHQNSPDTTSCRPGRPNRPVLPPSWASPSISPLAAPKKEKMVFSASKRVELRQKTWSVAPGTRSRASDCFTNGNSNFTTAGKNQGFVHVSAPWTRFLRLVRCSATPIPGSTETITTAFFHAKKYGAFGEIAASFVAASATSPRCVGDCSPRPRPQTEDQQNRFLNLPRAGGHQRPRRDMTTMRKGAPVAAALMTADTGMIATISWPNYC